MNLLNKFEWILLFLFIFFFLQAKKLFEKENDRVKMLLLFCADEDKPTAKAAAGALAILSNSLKVCQKIIAVSCFFGFFFFYTSFSFKFFLKFCANCRIMFIAKIWTLLASMISFSYYHIWRWVVISPFRLWPYLEMRVVISPFRLSPYLEMGVVISPSFHLSTYLGISDMYKLKYWFGEPKMLIL